MWRVGWLIFVGNLTGNTATYTPQVTRHSSTTNTASNLLHMASCIRVSSLYSRRNLSNHVHLVLHLCTSEVIKIIQEPHLTLLTYIEQNACCPLTGNPSHPLAHTHSRYSFPHHWNPSLSRSAGSTANCRKARFKSLFNSKHHRPFLWIRSTMSLVPDNCNLYAHWVTI